MFKGFHIAILATFIAIYQPLIAQKAAMQKADSLYDIGIEQLAFRFLESKYSDSIKSLANRVLEIGNGSNYPLGIVRGKLLAAIHYAGKFKLDTANSLLSECEQFFVSNASLVDSRDHGLVSYYKGEVVYRKMALEEAEKYAKHALSVFEKIGDLFMVGQVYRTFASLEILRQNDPKVLDFYTKAYEAKLRGGADEKELSKEFFGIASIYLKMGQFNRAEEFGNRILKIERVVKNTVDLVSAYELMSNIKFAINQPDSALYYNSLERAVAESTGNQRAIAMTTFYTADLYKKLNRFAESNRLLQPMLKASARNSTMVESLRAICAYNYLKLGRYDSAIYFARLAYNSKNKFNRKERHSEMAAILSEAFQAKKRNDSAIFYLKIHYALKDSLYSQENQRKLSSLYAEIETLGKQKEIERLENERLIQAGQNRILLLGLVFGGITFVFILVSIILFHRSRREKHMLEKIQLEQELKRKNRDLHDQALKMIHMNNGLAEIEEGLRKLRTEASIPSKDVLQVLSSLQINKSLEKEWDNFNEYFGSVHEGFFEKLNKQFPSTTLTEKRLAGLIKMNLTTGEIAGILNIESSSVKMAKYRLKKKLGLPDEQDIGQFLQAF